MPDFDISALSLASPPLAAPVTTYRPAVRVRNNGIHPADVTGNLRIYRREPPGDLLATHQLSLLNLGAGLEGDALSSGYWTPVTDDIGREFLFTAHVDTASDQNPGNNDLSPVTVIVTAGEPPPPPAVQAHATQHESGGGDQVEITGLHGLAADAQTALAHKTTHQAGGADVMNVDGLLGQLAEGQPIADHHESHEDGGGDKLYVGALHGELADNQPAKVHDNAKHDPNYTTVTEFNNHLADTTDVHEVATNLEHVAKKGKANGYAGLGANALVPIAQLAPIPEPGPIRFLRNDQAWGDMLAHASSHQYGGTDEISIAGLSGKTADDQDPTAHAVSHGAAGNDVISIAGLQGKALDAQDPVGHHTSHEIGGSDEITGLGAAPHKTTHEDGGADEISVAGLAGELADNQPPKSHGNAAHSVTFEDQAHKGAISGYCPLGADSIIPDEYLPPSVPAANAPYTLRALNSSQVVSAPGDTLVFGELTTNVSIRPNWCYRIILTGWVNPHAQDTYLQFLGKMAQGLVDTWLCSAVLLFPASPVNSQHFRYEARLYFREGSLSTSSDLGNIAAQSRSGDNALPWDKAVFTSWQWYCHLGTPLLTVYILSRQAILEPYTPP